MSIMANHDPIDQINRTLEAMFAERLRDLPDESFRLALKEKLIMEATISQPGHIREGFYTINPYLISAGAARLIDFLKQAFGAEELFRMPEPDGTIMHAEVQIGDSRLELSDGSERYPPSPTSLHLYVPDADAVYQRALAAGAKSLYEPVDREYGDRESGIIDTSGNQWFVSTHKENPGSHRPEGLHAVTMCLRARNAAGLIRFMEAAFAARSEFTLANPDGTLAHAKVRIGDSMIELGDAHGEWQPMPASIHLYVEDAGPVFAKALEAGATVIDPVTDKPYGERSGGVLDAWGNRWWIATHTQRT